ncbi:MAG: serine/threonine-protein kinase, partial [Pseudomonadota bacterium]
MADDFPEIPGFKILEMLGEGAMARVYLAVDESLDRKVALKIMLGSLAADVSFRERFLAEARDTAKFAHPGIVAIHTTGDHDGRYYLVLEYLESGTLKDHLKRKLSASADAQAETATGFTAREALVVTHQLAQALSYAHGKGVVH